mmetsp:Transcript_79593/g.158919  ORF Transcript_79593/g.158919 Transcript_79593/m.158919 type:complete len:441 (+) Transcript_79593:88-1410(+)
MGTILARAMKFDRNGGRQSTRAINSVIFLLVFVVLVRFLEPRHELLRRHPQRAHLLSGEGLRGELVRDPLRGPVQNHLLLQHVLVVQLLQHERESLRQARELEPKQLLHGADQVARHELVRVGAHQRREHERVGLHLGLRDHVLSEARAHGDVRALLQVEVGGDLEGAEVHHLGVGALLFPFSLEEGLEVGDGQLFGGLPEREGANGFRRFFLVVVFAIAAVVALLGSRRRPTIGRSSFILRAPPTTVLGLVRIVVVFRALVFFVFFRLLFFLFLFFFLLLLFLFLFFLFFHLLFFGILNLFLVDILLRGALGLVPVFLAFLLVCLLGVFGLLVLGQNKRGELVRHVQTRFGSARRANREDGAVLNLVDRLRQPAVRAKHELLNVFEHVRLEVACGVGTVDNSTLSVRSPSCLSTQLCPEELGYFSRVSVKGGRKLYDVR